MPSTSSKSSQHPPSPTHYLYTIKIKVYERRPSPVHPSSVSSVAYSLPVVFLTQHSSPSLPMAASTWTTNEMEALEGMVLLSGNAFHQEEQAAFALLLLHGGYSSVEQEDVVDKGSMSPSSETVATNWSTESIGSEASSRTTLEAMANDATAVEKTPDSSNDIVCGGGGGKGKGKEKHASSNGDK